MHKSKYFSCLSGIPRSNFSVFIVILRKVQSIFRLHLPCLVHSQFYFDFLCSTWLLRSKWGVSVWKQRVFQNSSYLFSFKSDWHTNGKLKHLETELRQMERVTFHNNVVMMKLQLMSSAEPLALLPDALSPSGARRSSVLNISTSRTSDGETPVPVDVTRV